MGPDIFYAMLDYGGGIQELEDVVLKIAGTFRCVGQLSSQLNNLIDSGLNDLTEGSGRRSRRCSPGSTAS